MSLAVNTNSWVTIAEADAYLHHNINAADWFDLSDEGDAGGQSKENYLISAFYWLLNSNEFDLTADLTNENVKNAQIEAALFLLDYNEDYKKRRAFNSMGIKSFTYSKWRENLSNVSIPIHIRDMLTDYQIGANTLVEVQYDGDNSF